MTGSKDKDTLDTFFKEAFEQLPETPSPTGWDAPATDMWSRIQADLTSAPKPPAARFSRLWYVGAVGVVALAALFLYMSAGQHAETVANQKEANPIPHTPVVGTQQAEPVAQLPAQTEHTAVAVPILVPDKKGTAKKSAEAGRVERVGAEIAKMKAEVPEISTFNANQAPNAAIAAEEVVEETLTVVTPDVHNSMEKAALEAEIFPEAKEETTAPPRRFPNNLERLKAESAKKEALSKNPLWLELLPKKEIPEVKF